MKKLLCVILALVLSLCGMAFAEEEVEETMWYELNEDGTILTVRLAANATTGYAWTYAISDPDGMELITEEYVADESKPGMVGVGGTWCASFRALGEGEHVEHLTFSYVRASEDCPVTLNTLDITVAANGKLTVDGSASTQDWVMLSEDCSTLTVSLSGNATTGYQWVYAIENENALELTREEYIVPETASGMTGVGGTWTADFHATGKESGTVAITLYYQRPWENTFIHKYDITVNIIDNSRIQLADVTMVTW